jgi:hypothetical protein
MPDLYKAVGMVGVLFENKYRFLKSQLERYYEVDGRTIERILVNNSDELSNSGYEVMTGERLKLFKKSLLDSSNLNDLEHSSIIKAPSLGVFTFKSFLNIGMLLVDSERARQTRSLILDIVIDVLNKRSGGKTKFINQREEKYLPAALDEFIYRKKFIDAIDLYIVDNNFKYSQLTDKVYKSIFKENSNEYRKILRLSSNDSVRSTLYSEVLRIVSDFENAFAKKLKLAFENKGEKLSLTEAHELFNEFSEKALLLMEASVKDARNKMASRDLAFRDALHEKLANYLKDVPAEDFEKFLGEQSLNLERQLELNKDVFKRLKDR